MNIFVNDKSVLSYDCITVDNNSVEMYIIEKAGFIEKYVSIVRELV